MENNKDKKHTELEVVKVGYANGGKLPEMIDMLEELNLSEIQIENDKIGRVKVVRNNYKQQIPNISSNQEKTDNERIKERYMENFGTGEIKLMEKVSGMRMYQS